MCEPQHLSVGSCLSHYFHPCLHMLAGHQASGGSCLLILILGTNACYCARLSRGSWGLKLRSSRLHVMEPSPEPHISVSDTGQLHCTQVPMYFLAAGAPRSLNHSLSIFAGKCVTYVVPAAYELFPTSAVTMEPTTQPSLVLTAKPRCVGYKDSD